MNQKLKEKLSIISVVIAATFIYIWKLWEEGLANLFYSAGVYSMGQNFHAFFYNSIDSVGFISIDKPPLGLWIQVLFTKVFGFNGMAILLPQALAGILSVYILYRIIKKRFRQTAGIASALVLALTPIMVVACRNNTIDGTLILMLVLASDQVIKAAEKSGMKHLLYTCVFIGLGFNIKMLQAFMIVPAVFLTYFVFSKEKIFKRLLSCGLSFVILIAISFSWVIAVDLTPAQSRPYVGSSGTNSALNLTLGNNGMGRLLGGDYKGSIALSINDKKNKADQNDSEVQPNQSNDTEKGNGKNKKGRPNDNNNGNNRQLPPINSDSNNSPPNDQIAQGTSQNPNQGDSQNSDQGALQNSAQNNLNNKGNGGESGETSILRLYSSKIAGQISWFLLPALAICLILLHIIFKGKLKEKIEYVALFYFSMCFMPMFIYFSFSNGVVHRYYLAMLAFPIAALIGIGLSFIKIKSETTRLIFPLSFGLIAATQLFIQSIYKNWLSWLLPFCAILFLIVLIIMLISMKFKIKKEVLNLLMATLLILPGIWSLTPILYGNNAQLPIAGPELVNQGDAFDKHPDLLKLIAYLNENRDDATYLAAVPSAMSMGAELIIQSGEPVMVLGGFNGGDNPVTVDEFKQLIADGTVKYAILSNDGAGNSLKQSLVLDWIAGNCSKVKEDLNGIVLYQLTIQE